MSENGIRIDIPVIRHRMRRRYAGCVLAYTLLLAGTSSLSAQGTVSGSVLDGATGRPIAYALVSAAGTAISVFASESGRFTLTGLEPGPITIRARQIGYQSGEAMARIDAKGHTDPLVLHLVPAAFVLPEIVVRGTACSESTARAEEAGTQSILDEAVKNAERLLVLEKTYPFRGSFDKSIWWLTHARATVRQENSTTRFDSREIRGYRVAEVLDGPSRAGEFWNYFGPADLARNEFRSSHCLWYAGRDTSKEGVAGYLIGFAPLANIESVDWAGDLLIDSTTFTLVRSRAHLVNLRAGRIGIASAECTVIFRPFAPTLLQEFQAGCTTVRSGISPAVVVERWLLRQFEFIKRHPAELDLPP